MKKKNQEVQQTGAPEANEGIISHRNKKRARLQAEGSNVKKKRSKRWIVLVVIILAAVVLLGAIRRFARHNLKTQSQYTYATAERRDITDTLTGSGTLEPANSYTVTTLISGDILSADFEEGDMVSKGDVLYKLDSSDKSTSIQRAELSVEQSQRAYDKKAASVKDLTITAPISGTVTGISSKVGDTVGTQAAIATIKDTSALTLTEYFSDEYAVKIYVGMPASVSVADQMLSLTGKVTAVSTQKRISDTGVSCFPVTVQVANPGSLAVGTSATYWLTIDGSPIYPSIMDENGFDASASTAVYAKIAGTVSDIKVKNNETVTAGQTIITLTDDSLDDELQNAAASLKDAQLSLQSQKNSLDEYTITAPIDGKIINKYYKQGEKTETGKALCTIFDLSSLNLTLNVDELDINKVAVGQTAVITTDAAPGKTYQGVITKIGIDGTTASGVTTYPVSIRITETDGLLPGMNADVSIIVKESKNTLAIPSDAVSYGNKVLVKTKDGSTGAGAPEGYEYIEIKTGTSDDNYVEITSGLTDGDTVAYIPKSTTGTGTMQGGIFGGGAARRASGGTNSSNKGTTSGTATSKGTTNGTADSKGTGGSAAGGGSKGGGGNAP